MFLRRAYGSDIMNKTRPTQTQNTQFHCPYWPGKDLLHGSKFVSDHTDLTGYLFCSFRFSAKHELRRRDRGGFAFLSEFCCFREEQVLCEMEAGGDFQHCDRVCADRRAGRIVGSGKPRIGEIPASLSVSETRGSDQFVPHHQPVTAL